MNIIISLRDLVDELQMLSQERNAYLKKSTGKIVTISDDDFYTLSHMEEFDEIEEDEPVEIHGAANGDLDDDLDLEAAFFQDVKNVMALDDDYIKLPSQFDIHEYEIIERFSLSIPNDRMRDTLLRKIRGAGAFRRFKETIYHYGIEEDWYKYRDQAYKEIAISWLQSHGFDYTDDMHRREKNA